MTIGTIDLTGVQISSFDLRNVKIRELVLSHCLISARFLQSNRHWFPNGMDTLDLSHNPISSLSNFEFMNVDRLWLSRCGIDLLKNVVFHSRIVCLDGNPIEIMKNVTFLCLFLAFFMC